MGKVDVKASDIKRFSVTGSTSATHVLSWTAPSEQALIITINGVKQQDGAYTIAGTPTTITLSSALVATDEMEVIGINDIGQTNTVAQDSIVTDMIRDDAVTTAKIANNQITTAKIADDQITSAKLANAINITSGNSLTIDSGATITNNGSAIGFGSASYKILKLAFDASSTTYSTTSGSWQTTDLSISYVPVSASSTLIVWGSLFVGTVNNAHGYAGFLVDGSTYQYGRFGGNYQGSDVIPIHYAFSTVNTSTKVIDARFVSGSGTTVYFNTGPYGTHGASYLTVMEVEYQ